MQVIPNLESKDGQVIVLYGDVPIIRKETIEKLVDKNRNEREAMTLLTAISDNPQVMVELLEMMLVKY